MSIKAGGQLNVRVANQGYKDRGLIVEGKLSINSGAGDDTISLNTLFVNNGSTTKISTGKGADTVTIDDCSFTAFTLNTGDGNDTVNLDCASGTTEILEFTGLVKIDMGNDDDQLRIGVAGDDKTKVYFLLESFCATFSGGKGTDTFLDENSFENGFVYKPSWEQ